MRGQTSGVLRLVVAAAIALGAVAAAAFVSAFGGGKGAGLALGSSQCSADDARSERADDSREQIFFVGCGGYF